MFLGSHYPRLDDKGRLVLPSRFREPLAAGLVLTRGQERCLFAFPTEEFTRIYEQLRAAPVGTRQARDFSRVLLSGASDEVPDKQGRLTVPASLRAYAGLTREVAVIGAGNRLEIWDQGAWASYLATAEEAFADSADRIVPDAW